MRKDQSSQRKEQSQQPNKGVDRAKLKLSGLYQPDEANAYVAPGRSSVLVPAATGAQQGSTGGLCGRWRFDWRQVADGSGSGDQSRHTLPVSSSVPWF